MTWHLKDRELEKKLIAIDPEFIDKLQRKEGYGNYGFYLDLGGYVCSGDCGVPKIQIYLVREELEEVPEYNPNGWNEFPAVTPPDSRVCQLTVSHSLDEPIKYFAAFYDFRAKTWRVQDSGRQIDTKVLKDGFVTFRAWRD